MAAGVMVGERVVAIDGVVVSTLDDVVAAITSRRPGDIAVLTLASRNAGSAVPDAQSSRDISVVLAAFAPTV
jgi:S1-C subfamily serine protease